MAGTAAAAGLQEATFPRGLQRAVYNRSLPVEALRPSFVRRWWLPLALAALGLVLLATKLSVRSVATGEAVIPGLAGAPVLGPGPTLTATASPSRVRLRVQVMDRAGQPVPQAIVEVRDRFNKDVSMQETGATGEALMAVPVSTGYVVTARKVGLIQGRVEAVDVARAQPGQPVPVVEIRLDTAENASAGAPGTSARLYVGHSAARLSLVDTSSNLLLKHSESLGPGRFTFLAPARDQTKLFASWSGSAEVLIINANDLSVEKQVALGGDAVAGAATPAAAAAGAATPPPAATGASGTFGGVTALAVNPLNGRLWVSTFSASVPDSSVLYELDPTGQYVLRRVAFGQASRLRFRPDGSLVYIAQRTASTLSFFDPVLATVVRVASLPQWPSDIALSPDGRSLYAVNLGSDRLVELDALSGDQKRSIEVGTGAVALAAHPDGRRLFIVNQLLGSLQVLDVATAQVADLIPVGRSPQAIALTPDGGSVYVANAGSGTVSLVDLDKKAVKETVSTGGAPSSLLLVRDAGN